MFSTTVDVIKLHTSLKKIENAAARTWYLQGVMTWKSYTAKCLPCDVKYDVIMKLETHTEDEKWLINTRSGHVTMVDS